MKSVALAILLLLGEPYPASLLSQDERRTILPRTSITSYQNDFVYVMTYPHTSDDGTMVPARGTMYRATSEGTLEKYYTTKDFAFDEHFITHDGRYIIGLNNSIGNPSDKQTQCIGIAREGQITKVFAPADLIERPKELKSQWHSDWLWIDNSLRPEIENQYDFRFLTVEHRDLVIDVTADHPSAHLRTSSVLNKNKKEVLRVTVPDHPKNVGKTLLLEGHDVPFAEFESRYRSLVASGRFNLIEVYWEPASESDELEKILNDIADHAKIKIERWIFTSSGVELWPREGWSPVLTRKTSDEPMFEKQGNQPKRKQ